MGTLNKVFDEEMKERHRKFVDRGFTINEICEELMIDRSTLFRNMRKYNLPRPPKPIALPKANTPTVDEYKKFKRDGLTDTKIASMCSVSSRTLWKWKIKMGLQDIRKKKGKKVKEDGR